MSRSKCVWGVCWEEELVEEKVHALLEPCLLKEKDTKLRKTGRNEGREGRTDG